MTTLVETGFLPKLWELLVILGVSGLMVLLGVIVQRRVAGTGLPLPFPVALALFIAMLASFCGLFYIFVLASPMQTRVAIEAGFTDPIQFTQPVVIQNRQIFLLLWSFLVYLPVMFYYISLLRNSYATRIVDRIGPLSARIEDPSEFASARKLALRGDVDGAVSMYKSYRDNPSEALFEAARLLKGEDRFAEAASVFQEIAERFQERRGAWAEATYNLAKINEINLRNISGAAALYKEILDRTPESRFSPQAHTDLSRIQIANEEIGVELVDTPKAGAERDPFFGRGRGAAAKPIVKTEPPRRVVRRSPGAIASSNGDTGADEAPSVDPFMGLREKQRAAAVAAASETSAATIKKPATKKAAAAKKPAATKAPATAKATAKPAPAARKKATAKKPSAKKKPSA